MRSYSYWKIIVQLMNCVIMYQVIVTEVLNPPPLSLETVKNLQPVNSNNYPLRDVIYYVLVYYFWISLYLWTLFLAVSHNFPPTTKKMKILKTVAAEVFNIQHAIFQL